MSDDDTAKELAAYIRYARAVARALPVDDEVDRQVTALLNQRPADYTPRKITKKRTP
jgi:hypothetical protein